MHLFKYVLTSIYLYRFVFYLAVISGCAVAFLPVDRGLQPNLDDKFLHFTSFMVLTLLFQLAHPDLKKWIYLIVLMILGIFIEVVQSTLPYRSFESLDWLADVSGVVVYLLCFSKLISKFILYSKS